jgi:cation diffusion facilitator family transporter
MNHKLIREGEKVAKEGIFHLMALGLLKLVAGLLTGMTVLTADAISTFTDITGIFASYIGLKLSRKSADQDFEFGYYKMETAAALCIAAGIMYVGVLILKDSIENFHEFIPGEHQYVAIAITIFAIFHSGHLAKKLMKTGIKVNSLSLIASARDKKIDVIAGFAILFSIAANYLHIPYVESVVSILIALFILKIGIFTSKESIFFLLDYWDDPKLLRKIKKTLKKENDIVIKINKIRLRRAGTYIFGQAFVNINPYAGIQDLREELEILTNKVKDLSPYIKDFDIYSHIPKAKLVKIAVPIKKGNDLDATVASTLKETSGYLFVEISDNKVENFYFKQLSEKQKKPTQLDNFIKIENPNILIDNKLHSLIYYNLRRTHHILIYPNFSDIKKVKQTIALLLIDT